MCQVLFFQFFELDLSDRWVQVANAPRYTKTYPHPPVPGVFRPPRALYARFCVRFQS